MSISSVAHNQDFRCHKFTITEWNSRCVQAWESGIRKGGQIERQKQLWDFFQSWISVLMLRLGGGGRAGTVQRSDVSGQWNNCWGNEPEGVCYLDILVRKILAGERLTAHSLRKEKLPTFNIWGQMMGVSSVIAKHLPYRIFSKMHSFVTLNYRLGEWQAAAPTFLTMERDQETILHRKSLTHENCWTPKLKARWRDPWYREPFIWKMCSS